MFRKMPIFLLALIGLIVCLDSFIPLNVKSFFYSLSLSVKSLIIFVLPLIIFMLLFKTLAQLSSKATKMILVILAGVCVSNFISTMISYFIGSGIYHTNVSLVLPQEGAGLAPLWVLNWPKLIANDHAMFAGILSGIFLAKFRPLWAEKMSRYVEKIVSYMLRAITFVLPIFITGFVIKIVHDKTLKTIIGDYSVIFVLIALSLFSYIATLYLTVNRFDFSRAISSIKNMLPAALTGFSSMSSAAAMPLTIIATEKNSQNPPLARLAIPATVNTHLIGDCFAIPIFAFAVMKNFGMAEPTFYSYLLFACYFVMAKFSVAAIPGGGIIVMLPILETQFGFTSEMASLITALYVLFDPVITGANVIGNGAFALILNKLRRRRVTV